jgi:UDP-2-acetamido-2,6-beta-L-arabino-hexul-4-ose reductase
MKVVLTGAAGFLGWHTRVRLRAVTEHEVVPVTRDSWADLQQHLAGVDAVVHVAGVNRGSPEEVESDNVRLAKDVAYAVTQAGAPVRVVFANSIQAGNETPYGAGKAHAAEVLAHATKEVDGRFVDVRLPNLFGEGGRPAYNSFVATFVDAVVRGQEPSVQDRAVDLLHAQDAAQSLIDALDTPEDRLEPAGTSTSVVEVLDLLREFHTTYASSGDFPPLHTKLRVDLFNTYRTALFPTGYPIPLTAREDERGRLVETVRAHWGQGQTFVSTTRPRVTRGEHFHLGKVERFVVLAGTAQISLRRVFTDEVVSFEVTGDAPAIVDMPTMWVHNITNTGDTEVVTLFWTNTLFDAENPDTFWEPVLDPAKEVSA